MNTTPVKVRECNVTGKVMLGNRAQAKAFLRAYGWKMGCRKVYWCVFCEEYHSSKAERGRWQA
jgi:hypothetical protein